MSYSQTEGRTQLFAVRAEGQRTRRNVARASVAACVMRESRARLHRRHDALQLLVEVLNEREIGAAATIRISSLRYLDAFVKVDGAWLFGTTAVRRLDRRAPIVVTRLSGRVLRGTLVSNSGVEFGMARMVDGG